MKSSSSVKGLCSFIGKSPTPFHAVSQMVASLEAAGWSRLAEEDQWQLAAGGRYFVTRNDSSLVALRLGTDDLLSTGLRMIGAHTDSPCLKVKPNPELRKFGYLQLGVEVYGGALLNPWFDRDLSLAGRVVYSDQAGKLCAALVDFKEPIAFIPSLAIHLDREVNQKRSINPQTDLPPLLLQLEEGDTADFRALLKQRLLAEGQVDEVQEVLDYELCLYDHNPPALVGLKKDFVAAARLDNLLSCYAGLQALLDSSAGIGTGSSADAAASSSLLVCTDHEEVGSLSAAGAGGPFLESVLQRMMEALGHSGIGAQRQMLARSLMVSVDNAHAIHPNYADRHDSKHGPLMNAGPVIKYNSNQRYATNSRTGAIWRKLCADNDIPCQSFVVRSDMGCGSTIGPLVASELGVDTLDIGVATLGMHSIRELAGSRDIDYLRRLLTSFLVSQER